MRSSKLSTPLPLRPTGLVTGAAGGAHPGAGVGAVVGAAGSTGVPRQYAISASTSMLLFDGRERGNVLLFTARWFLQLLSLLFGRRCSLARCLRCREAREVAFVLPGRSQHRLGQRAPPTGGLWWVGRLGNRRTTPGSADIWRRDPAI